MGFHGISWDFMGFHIWETMVSEGDVFFLLALIVHELGMTKRGPQDFLGAGDFCEGLWP
jgi:hypothetical protein